MVKRQEENPQRNAIFIIEDLAEKINSSSNQEKFKTFLYQSRHARLSIILICHDIKSASKRTFGFENAFFNNLTGTFIMTPTSAPLTYCSPIISKVSDFSKKECREIIKESHKFGPFPYIFISTKYILYDSASRVRFDIFGKNALLLNKVNN